MNYSLWIGVLTYLPKTFFAAVFLPALFFYVKRRPFYKPLVFAAVAFHFFYAFLKTVLQYFVWSQNEFTSLLLNSSLDGGGPVPAVLDKICRSAIVNCQKHGYFLFYSYGRFWLNVLLSVGVAFAFYLFLKLLKKYRERFFEAGETELGFLAALLVGWPNFSVFVPLVFAFVLLVALSRRLFLREFYTTLGAPFLLAALATMVWGEKLVKVLGLEVLKI